MSGRDADPPGDVLRGPKNALRGPRTVFDDQTTSEGEKRAGRPGSARQAGQSRQVPRLYQALDQVRRPPPGSLDPSEAPSGPKRAGGGVSVRIGRRTRP